MTAHKWPLTRRVEVEWEDSTSTGGWAEPDKHREWSRDRACRSIGYLLQSTKTEVVLAQSMGSTKINDCIAIPRGCVRKVTRLS